MSDCNLEKGNEPLTCEFGLDLIDCSDCPSPYFAWGLTPCNWKDTHPRVLDKSDAHLATHMDSSIVIKRGDIVIYTNKPWPDGSVTGPHAGLMVISNRGTELVGKWHSQCCQSTPQSSK